MKNFYYNLSILQSRLSSHFASEKSFGNERFALPHEIAHLSFETPHDYGLILGVDHFRPYTANNSNEKPSQSGQCLESCPKSGRKEYGF